MNPHTSFKDILYKFETAKIAAAFFTYTKLDNDIK